MSRSPLRSNALMRWELLESPRAWVLRMLDDADLDQLFEWERNPRAVAMAAFTRPIRRRAGFDARYQRVRVIPQSVVRHR